MIFPLLVRRRSIRPKFLKKLFKRTSRLRNRLAELNNLAVFQMERGGCVHSDIFTLLAGGRQLLGTLEGCMENDVCLARVALKLHQHEIVGRHTHRREIDRNALAALGAPHLLVNTLNDLLKRVGVQIHPEKYSIKRGSSEKNLLFLPL